MGDEQEGKVTYHIRCVVCNIQLNKFQQTRNDTCSGLCTDCCQSVNDSLYDPVLYMTPEVREKDVWRMMNPPMGDKDEFFQDVENEYTGGGSSD